MASGHLQRTSCSRYGCLSRLYGEGNVIQGGGNSLQINQLPAKAGNGPNAGQTIGYKRVESKTTYDPAILSDSKVADMSNKAAKQSEGYFLSNPSQNAYDIKIDGYWFRVTHDVKKGKITNSFITMPPRNTK